MLPWNIFLKLPGKELVMLSSWEIYKKKYMRKAVEKWKERNHVVK